MAIDEVPVEGRERAGIRADRSTGVVRASRAVVAHPVDVGAARDVGLGGETRIGVLAHAHHVGCHDPVEGIDEQLQEPVIDLAWLDASEQSPVAEHHQPLDVVRMAGGQDLAERLAKAAHPRLTRPVERRQVERVTEQVRLTESRHPGAVGVAQVLPPTQELPDEALHGGQWDRPLDIGSPFGVMERGQGRLTGFASGQQPKVQRHRQQGVGQHRLAVDHGVLVRPEVPKSLRDERVQREQGVGTSDRPREPEGRSGVLAEGGVDPGDHICRQRVGQEQRGTREGRARWWDAPVLCIEVPGTTLRLRVRRAGTGR